MTRIDDIMRIADNYGLLRQTIKLCEEINELQRAANQAIIELTCDSKLSRTITDNLVDEMADVSIMIEQIAYLTGTQAALHNRIGFKIDRQLGRMSKETE